MQFIYSLCSVLKALNCCERDIGNSLYQCNSSFHPNILLIIQINVNKVLTFIYLYDIIAIIIFLRF